MSNNEKPHWIGFKEAVLTSMTTAAKSIGLTIDFTSAYKNSLSQYGEIDWFLFQNLPIITLFCEFTNKLAIRGQTEAAAHLSQVFKQEAYHVASFEKLGCKTIRPSADLVSVLTTVPVDWSLCDIAAPAQHLFIRLPPTSGLFVRHILNNEERVPADGLYVTWKAVAEESKIKLRQMKERGELMRNSECYIGAPDIPINEQSVGDFNFRALMIARDTNEKHIEHPYHLHYFRSHWPLGSTETAESLHSRMKDWHVAEVADGVEDQQNRLNAFRLVCNLFLYMSQPLKCKDVEYRPSPERQDYIANRDRWCSKRRRRKKEQLFNNMPTDDWIVGQHVVVDKTIEPTDTEPGTPTGRSVRTHWRRSHWHRYWITQEDGKKVLVPKLLSSMLVKGKGTEPPTETTWEVR